MPPVLPTQELEPRLNTACPLNVEDRCNNGEKDCCLIAVMGATGSGKTSFINLVSGSKLAVSHGLDSSTDGVQESGIFEVNGRPVKLIDTPGFDDTARSDIDVLHMIAEYLSSRYQRGNVLQGVIWMHSIADDRMRGRARRDFQLFQAMCGTEGLSNCAIVTNRRASIDDKTDRVAIRDSREDERFLLPIESSAYVWQHNSSLSSAQDIIRHLLGNNPAPLKIQRELIDEHMNLADTAVGQMLYGSLLTVKRKHEEDIRQMQYELDAFMEQCYEDERQRKELQWLFAGSRGRQREVLEEKVAFECENIVADR